MTDEVDPKSRQDVHRDVEVANEPKLRLDGLSIGLQPLERPIGVGEEGMGRRFALTEFNVKSLGEHAGRPRLGLLEHGVDVASVQALQQLSEILE
ncbi:hypothetical protein D3C71_1793090 [compost metagenome]